MGSYTLDDEFPVDVISLVLNNACERRASFPSVNRPVEGQVQRNIEAGNIVDIIDMVQRSPRTVNTKNFRPSQCAEYRSLENVTCRRVVRLTIYRDSILNLRTCVGGWNPVTVLTPSPKEFVIFFYR
jgi:hypothetical protein